MNPITIALGLAIAAAIGAHLCNQNAQKWNLIAAEESKKMAHSRKLAAIADLREERRRKLADCNGDAEAEADVKLVYDEAIERARKADAGSFAK
jgi:hypothetical protein